VIAPMVLAVLLLQAANPEALSEQALGQAQLKNFGEAERLWKQALAAAPALYSANFNLGYMYQSQGRFADAEPYLRKAASAQPRDFNAQYLLGAVLAQLGKSDDALRAWRAALTIRPGHLKLMRVMAVEYSKGRYFREAAAVAEKALAMKQDDVSLWLTAVKAHQDGDDHVAALKLAARMIAAFPLDPRAAFEYGFELSRAGRPGDAAPYLKRAMEARQPWEEPFYFYGDTLVKEGRHEEAIPVLRRALELRRDYMAAWNSLGRALMGAARLDEAKAALLEAVKINPSHPQPHLLLSQLYFRLGDEAKASEERAISAKLRKENPGALEGLPARAFPSR